jgi:hypothetical protein
MRKNGKIPVKPPAAGFSREASHPGVLREASPVINPRQDELASRTG